MTSARCHCLPLLPFLLRTLWASPLWTSDPEQTLPQRTSHLAWGMVSLTACSCIINHLRWSHGNHLWCHQLFQQKVVQPWDRLETFIWVAIREFLQQQASVIVSIWLSVLTYELILKKKEQSKKTPCVVKLNCFLSCGLRGSFASLV